MAGKKINRKRWKSFVLYGLTVVFWLAAAFISLNIKGYNTPVALTIIEAALLILLIRAAGNLPLTFQSYFFLFPVLFTFEFRLLWAPNFLIPFLTVLFIAIVLFLQNQPVQKFFIDLSFLEILSVILIYGYHILFNRLSKTYYEIGNRFSLTPVQKTVLILSVSSFFFLAFIAVVRFLGEILTRNQSLFQMASDRVAGLEIYIFIFVSLSCTSIGLVQFFDIFPKYIMRWVAFFILFANTAYICLMLHAISVKNKMNAIENEKNAVSAYTADLETSLVHMREIRHDVKNLFLTMGSFVESSGNDDMKQFYHENIIPFIQDAIIKNDLHDKLRALSDEQLKSFFYYKLTEKISYGVHVKLEINSLALGEIGSGDLIRLLGILIDNAAEESVFTPEKCIGIRIADDSTRTSFRISNSFRPETQKRGVIRGTTDKGLGRGNGLVIAGKIIEKYENVILNSYFTEDEFVQNLSILKT